MRRALHTARNSPPHRFVATWCLVATGCVAAPQDPDPTLTEAIDWYTGVAGMVDDARVRQLLEEAAAGEGPLADAITQLRLGEAFEAGRGVARDLERAREWYERAAVAGNRQARDALERLGR